MWKYSGHVTPILLVFTLPSYQANKSNKKMSNYRTARDAHVRLFHICTVLQFSGASWKLNNPRVKPTFSKSRLPSQTMLTEETPGS